MRHPWATMVVAFTLAFTCFNLTLKIAEANAIVQPQISDAITISISSPIGQTFTAEDAKISTIGFDLDAYVPSSVTYTLRTGVGTTGVALASNTFNLAANFHGYVDAPFTSVSLVPGQTYTVLLSAVSGGPQVEYNQIYKGNSLIPGKVDYTGGAEIYQGILAPDKDLTFRVEPVPENSGRWLLLSLVAVVGVYQLRAGGVKLF